MARSKSVRVAASDQTLIDRGCELDATIKRLTKELGEIKDRIRREAGLNLRVDINEVELTGEQGVVSVIYPKEMHKVDDTRISELRQLLGNSFDEFVETRVVYKATDVYPDLLSALSSPARGVVSSIVLSKQSTPRVTFGKLRTLPE